LIDRWHADIGTAILESWEVPEEISNAVLNGAEYGYTHRGAPDLTDVVIAADLLDGKFYSSMEGHEEEWGELPPALEMLGLDREKSTVLIDDTRDELALIFQAIA